MQEPKDASVSVTARRTRRPSEKKRISIEGQNLICTSEVETKKTEVRKKVSRPASSPNTSQRANRPKAQREFGMPAPGGFKRVRNVQIFRPFVYGTEAVPFGEKNPKPKDVPSEHTHKWKVFVRGVNGDDISYWLRKVQFKLHDTYANSVRMIESPPFEVEETGWGEFEIAIKFYFVPESAEKPSTIWHALKLHPYGEDVAGQKERGDTIKSICYEEVLFNEPVEPFYNMLTGDLPQVKGKGKAGKAAARAAPTAEIPERITKDNVYSREEESKELDRLGEAVKMVERMIAEEKAKLVVQDEKLRELERTEGKPSQKRK